VNLLISQVGLQTLAILVCIPLVRKMASKKESPKTIGAIRDAINDIVTTDEPYTLAPDITPPPPVRCSGGMRPSGTPIRPPPGRLPGRILQIVSSSPDEAVIMLAPPAEQLASALAFDDQFSAPLHEDALSNSHVDAQTAAYLQVFYEDARSTCDEPDELSIVTREHDKPVKVERVTDDEEVPTTSSLDPLPSKSSLRTRPMNSRTLSEWGSTQRSWEVALNYVIKRVFPGREGMQEDDVANLLLFTVSESAANPSYTMQQLISSIKKHRVRLVFDRREPGNAPLTGGRFIPSDLPLWGQRKKTTLHTMADVFASLESSREKLDPKGFDNAITLLRGDYMAQSLTPHSIVAHLTGLQKLLNVSLCESVAPPPEKLPRVTESDEARAPPEDNKPSEAEISVLRSSKRSKRNRASQAAKITATAEKVPVESLSNQHSWVLPPGCAVIQPSASSVSSPSPPIVIRRGSDPEVTSNTMRRKRPERVSSDTQSCSASECAATTVHTRQTCPYRRCDRCHGFGHSPRGCESSVHHATAAQCVLARTRMRCTCLTGDQDCAFHQRSGVSEAKVSEMISSAIEKSSRDIIGTMRAMIPSVPATPPGPVAPWSSPITPLWPSVTYGAPQHSLLSPQNSNPRATPPGATPAGFNVDASAFIPSTYVYSHDGVYYPTT
jgi:hypothetical protein